MTLYTTVIITGPFSTYIGTNRDNQLVAMTTMNLIDWSKVGKD